MSDNLQSDLAKHCMELEAKLASQQAAHDAEIEKLKEELQSLRDYHSILDNDEIKQLHRALSAANAACAMKDEALSLAQIGSCTCLTKTNEPELHAESCMYRVLAKALSATTQQVSEWERNRLEPLRDEIAELKMELDCAKNRVCSEIATLCAAGTDFIEKSNQSIPMVEIQAAEDVLRAVISNTQATAEQFIAECEQRGAVKALEELYEFHGETDWYGKIKEIIESINTPSKKAGRGS